jgi:NADH dehydrogenase/NADH:ubiquinone oxidoreductase subunit G
MTAVRLTINEQTIETFAGQTVLEAAGAHGLIIPTLCDHPDLMPVGSCRLCWASPSTPRAC